MKLNELRDKLMAVARKNQPGDHVPYAFEKRVMSRITTASPANLWAMWSGPLWRAALSCMAITILCGVCSLAFQRPADAQESFSQAFEAAVLAPPSQPAEGAW